MNAGVNLLKPLLEWEPDEWDKVIGANIYRRDATRCSTSEDT